MTHGHFVFLDGNGPLRGLPICWFAYEEDALAWATEHGSESYALIVKPATPPKPSPY